MLVTVKQLMTSMGLTPALEADLKGTLTSVISQAELKAEELLGSRLTKRSGTDTFSVDSDLFCGVTKVGAVRLRLSRKFVIQTAGNPVLVTSDSRVLASDDFLVDVERGILTIKDGASVDGTQVVVEYDSGFSDGDDIPERLRQALYKLASRMVVAHQTGDNAQAQSNAVEAGKLAADNLSYYAQPVGFYFSPVLSESVDADV